MKKIIVITILLAGNILHLFAQEQMWSLNDCMLYAVENSPRVKQKIYQADNYGADELSALGAFLPSIGAGTNAEFSYGRSLTEDNTYQNVSSLYNNYYMQASLSLFTGGQLINQWKQAQVNRKMGKSEEQLAKDELAMNTMQAYMDVIYHQEMIRIAIEKLEESSRNLIQTQRMEDLGLKSKADVAQIEAQVAGDDYFLTQQENLYNTSLLKLKELMNYPYDEPLYLDSTVMRDHYLPEPESVEEIYEYAEEFNPQALAAKYQLKSSQYQYRMAKGRFFPTISMSAGVTSNYYKPFSTPGVDPFHDQFKNKMGEYFSFSLSFPLFDRFGRFTNLKKSRNNMRIAAEQQTEILRQIQNAIEQNVLDRNGYAKEIVQMEKQVKANDMAYQLTLRKYEEGLMSSLDLQTSSYNLLQSRSNLLQRRLMYLIKDKVVDYYKGIPLIENK
ncbi:MAG: TolC family protein [Tannerellaceae bacterium]|nr:TolC family protein [Tannerellaceae bacterium]